MSADPLGDAIRSREMSIPGSKLMDVGEVVRCARGVVRTAHPEKVYEGVVREWWVALKNALDVVDGAAGVPEGPTR